MNTDHSNIRARLRDGLLEHGAQIDRDAELSDGPSLEARVEGNLRRAVVRMRTWFPTVARIIDSTTAASQPWQDGDAYNRFEAMLHRIRSHPRYQSRETARAPYGQYARRAIIGESTTIDQGVYLSAQAREALVVDHTHGALERGYRELLAWIRARGGAAISEEVAVRSVITVVERFIKFSPEGCENLLAREEVHADTKMSLDLFIQEGVGVARHQVLMAGFLLERLQQQGVLAGHSSLDPTSYRSEGDDERLIYTARNGSVFVYDPLANAKLA